MCSECSDAISPRKLKFMLVNIRLLSKLCFKGSQLSNLSLRAKWTWPTDAQSDSLPRKVVVHEKSIFLTELDGCKVSVKEVTTNYCVIIPYSLFNSIINFA